MPTTQELFLAQLDREAVSTRKTLERALEHTDDEHLMKSWRFSVAGETVTEAPRHIMLSDSVFSHLAHHRGQLTVYLRLNEASVPAIYGPSADEQE